MKQIINSKHLSTIIFLLSIVVAVKLIWLVVSLLFLPNNGESHQTEAKAKKLYYRVRLTNESNVIAPVKTTQASKRQVNSMRGYKLLGLYNASDKLVVTVEKGRKTTILVKDEEIEGFKLVGAGRDYALFKKNGQEFKLSLPSGKQHGQSANRKVVQPKHSPIKKSSTNKIQDQGGTKVISRDLLTSYVKDMDKIWRDISIAQHRSNGKLDGFKINYVKKNSDFEKPGLKRGDILKAINAQELNSMNAAMDFYKEINDIENLTLTVERNGRSEDLEYEIQ
jgi:general secretion pathway protein C